MNIYEKSIKSPYEKLYYYYPFIPKYSPNFTHKTCLLSLIDDFLILID